jgi:flagellar basal body-associated protein FliL
MIALTTASVLLVVLTGLLLIDSNTVRLHLPFFGTNIHKKPDTYVSVGPVITSVDSGDLIKMTLDINCSKKSYRKTVRELDSRVRSRIIWALQTPTAAGLLRSGDYMGLRRYLAARVKEVFPKGMVTEIYISQFLRY